MNLRLLCEACDTVWTAPPAKKKRKCPNCGRIRPIISFRTEHLRKEHGGIVAWFGKLDEQLSFVLLTKPDGSVWCGTASRK